MDTRLSCCHQSVNGFDHGLGRSPSCGKTMKPKSLRLCCHLGFTGFSIALTSGDKQQRVTMMMLMISGGLTIWWLLKSVHGMISDPYQNMMRNIMFSMTPLASAVFVEQVVSIYFKESLGTFEKCIRVQRQNCRERLQAKPRQTIA